MTQTIVHHNENAWTPWSQKLASLALYMCIYGLKVRWGGHEWNKAASVSTRLTLSRQMLVFLWWKLFTRVSKLMLFSWLVRDNLGIFVHLGSIKSHTDHFVWHRSVGLPGKCIFWKSHTMFRSQHGVCIHLFIFDQIGCQLLISIKLVQS